MKKIITMTFIFALMLISQNSYAHKVGNGGDYLRATYISMGKVVVDYLNNTKDGQKLIRENELNLTDLEDSLDINRIKVTEVILKDNTGSVVDALGVPSLVTLNSAAWFDHFQNARDVYYIVFHEMLRSIGVDDDNYRVSAALKNFPLSLRIETRVSPNLPLIEQDRLTGIFDDKKIALGGSGCSNTDGEIITELNEEKNIFQISMKNYRISGDNGKNLEYKTCAISIPVKVPASKRIVISLIDLSGELNLQAGVTSKLSFEAFLTGGQQKLLEKQLGSNVVQQNSFLMRKSDVLKSSCGGSDLMRINSNLLAQKISAKNDYVSVKSIQIFLSIEDCKK
jgi:hypothetical protein